MKQDLGNGPFVHRVGSDLLVDVEQSVEEAGAAVQQLVRNFGVDTERCPLQLQQPGQTFLHVWHLLQPVVDHRSNRQRARVPAQESYPPAVQNPHGPLDVV